MRSVSAHRLNRSFADEREALHQQFFRRGFEYFFPDRDLRFIDRCIGAGGLRVRHIPDGWELVWRGVRYRCAGAAVFTAAERVLLQSVGRVLCRRVAGLRTLRDAVTSVRPAGTTFEDQCIADFLASKMPHSTTESIDGVFLEVIGALRQVGSTTYENRRITTGVLVLSDARSPFQSSRQTQTDCATRRTVMKTLHRVCDGLQAMAIVDQEGRVQDVMDFSTSMATDAVPYPIASLYTKHAAATLNGDSICFVLTPNGELKTFRHGVQVAGLAAGRWRLTEFPSKYRRYRGLVRDATLAQRLMQVALNLREARRGAMFVVLDDRNDVNDLISTTDTLAYEGAASGRVRTKHVLHYLMRNRNALDMPVGMLESVAAMDGAVVLSATGELIAVGALLRTSGGIGWAEGARTTAAIAASERATVVKVCEDGGIALLSRGRIVWDL